MRFPLESAALLAVASAAPPPFLQLCDQCLKEPLETDYWGPHGELPRHRNFTKKEFYHKALLGKAFVVEEALKGGALEGWTCEKMIEKFPNSRHRIEYDWEKNPDDENRVQFDTKTWATEGKKGIDADKYRKKDPAIPLYAPYYWAVREFEQYGKCGPNDIRKDCPGPKKDILAFRKLINESFPDFLDLHSGHDTTGDVLRGQTEVWTGPQNAGARAHMDSHCIPTLQYVVSGKRHWRLSHIPRVEKGAGKITKNVVFDDGVCYSSGWTPSHTATVVENDMLFFPPGWIHETTNLAPKCHLALVTQFNFPPPIHYYRNYYNRIRRIGDLQSCWEWQYAWANFGDTKLPKKMPRYADAKKTAEKKFAALDTDGDGALTEDEFKKGVKQGKGKNRFTGSMETDKGSFLWYDLDLDGKVTKEELVETYASWSETEFHIGQEKEVKGKKDLSKSKFKLDLDMLHYDGVGKQEL